MWLHQKSLSRPPKDMPSEQETQEHKDVRVPKHTLRGSGRGFSRPSFAWKRSLFGTPRRLQSLPIIIHQPPARPSQAHLFEAFLRLCLALGPLDSKGLWSSNKYKRLGSATVTSRVKSMNDVRGGGETPCNRTRDGERSAIPLLARTAAESSS